MASHRSVFTVRRENVTRTMRDSGSVMSAPCTIETDDGVQGGVAIFTGGTPRITLTADAARRLALQIADVLEDLGRKA